MRRESVPKARSDTSSSVSATAETAEHRHLKHLALRWAQANGYPIAAAEVSLPTFRFRLDAAAYRPGSAHEVRLDLKTGRPRRVPIAAVGLTAIFECKASRPDYLRDSRSINALTKRLAVLGARKQRHEETLKIHYPSIRNGDSLFAEFETLNFERPGYEVYQQVLAEMRKLTARLHANTKFDKLTTWRVANVRFRCGDDQRRAHRRRLRERRRFCRPLPHPAGPHLSNRRMHRPVINRLDNRSSQPLREWQSRPRPRHRRVEQAEGILSGESAAVSYPARHR